MSSQKITLIILSSLLSLVLIGISVSLFWKSRKEGAEVKNELLQLRSGTTGIYLHSLSAQ